ncbi:MAG: hypothetical protein ACLU0O_01935 [Collinsella sp.]
MALVANAAANNAYNATSGDANASADYSYVDEAITADEEAVAARRAAESSLWGAPAQQQAAEAAPYNANLASMPIISGAADIDLDDLDEPAAITASIDAQDRIDIGDLPDASLEVDVPMADYSGHEDMWAAATAILDEIDEPAPVAVPTPVAALSLLLPPMSAVTALCSPRIPPVSRARASSGPRYCRRHYGKSSSRARQSDPRGRDRAPAVLYRQAYGPCLSERYRGRYRQLRAAPRGGITSAWLRSIENGRS